MWTRVSCCIALALYSLAFSVGARATTATSDQTWQSRAGDPIKRAVTTSRPVHSAGRRALSRAHRHHAPTHQVDSQTNHNLSNRNTTATWELPHSSHLNASELSELSALHHRLNLHNFNISLTALEMGMGHVETWRLHRFAHKLIRDEPVTVAAVGGSITWGVNTDRGKADWFTLLKFWLQDTFPNVKFRWNNNAYPGSPSNIMLGCSRALGLDHNADLMFIEYVINDGLDGHAVPHGPFNIDRPQIHRWEQLLRKLYAFPNHPALVHMAVLGWWMACDQIPFYETAEDQYNIVGQYYGTGSLSLRNSFFQMKLLNSTALKKGTFNATTWYNGTTDCSHPHNGGHRVMADLAILMIKSAVQHVLHRGFHELDEAGATAPLPPPLFPGNEAPPEARCILATGLKGLLQGAKGFEFINEGSKEKPKWGYVATEPGAELTLKVPVEGPTNQLLSIMFLKSYQHMGMARVECLQDCDCEPKFAVIDGNNTLHWSQLVGTKFAYANTTTGACTLRFTVLNETNSGEHKFKLGGLQVGGNWNGVSWQSELYMPAFN